MVKPASWVSPSNAAAGGAAGGGAMAGMDKDRRLTDPDEIPSGISLPKDVKHETHIRYDVDQARYVNFPAGWARINVQFGVPLAALPKVRLSSQ